MVTIKEWVDLGMSKEGAQILKEHEVGVVNVEYVTGGELIGLSDKDMVLTLKDRAIVLKLKRDQEKRNWTPSLKEVPSWEGNPEEYLSKLRRFLMVKKFTGNQWYKCCMLALPSYEASILESDTNEKLSWEEAEKKLREMFGIHDDHMKYVELLKRMHLKADEKLGGYTDKYLHYWRKSGAVDSVAAAKNFLMSLPEEMRFAVDKLCTTYDPVKKVIEHNEIESLLVMVDSIKTLFPNRVHSRHREHTTHHKHREHRSHYKHRDHHSHHKHKEHHHSTSHHKHKEHHHSTSHHKQFTGKCNFCEKKGHKMVDCFELQKLKAKRTKNIKRVAEPSEDEGISWEYQEEKECSGDDAELRLVNVQQVSAADKRLIKININGEDRQLLMDTGADVSCISKDLATKSGIGITEETVEVKYAAKNVKQTLSKTEKIPIRLNGKAFEWSFLVMDMESDGLLGWDLFKAAGLFLGGFNLDENKISMETTPKVEKEVEEEVEGSKEALSRLATELKLNKELTEGKFCSLPEAVVQLDTTANKPVFTPQYRIPEAFEIGVAKQIEEWLVAGVIIEAPLSSQYNSPITVVHKKGSDGKVDPEKIRVCVDFRRLNEQLKTVDFTLPNIVQMLEELAGSKVYSSLDLKSAYHSFRIAKEDRIKTTITWKRNRYMFEGCPFGLKTMSAIFQRVMTGLLKDLDGVLFFIDDILIFTETVKENEELVKKVINRITEAKLKINESKCKFFRSDIYILGHRVFEKGIRLDSRKLVNMGDWPIPTTKKQLQHYLGFFNYFRRFIPLYASVTAPLDRIRRKDVKQNWGKYQQQAWDKILKLLEMAPILRFPEFGKKFFLATDASKRGLGAVLFQEMENGEKAYISFQARALRKYEGNYPVSKLEVLAVIFALRKFRYYLLGRRFTLFTDHMALTSLFSAKKTNPAIMMRWLEIILEYDFSVIHLPGVKNVLPDHLSRIFRIQLTPTIKTGEVLNPKLREQEMEKAHLEGHFGAGEIYKKLLSRGFHWEHMLADAVKFCAGCATCMRYQIHRQGFNPLQSVDAKLPWDHIAMDLAGPIKPTSNTGERFVLVVVDVFTRFTILRAIPDKRKETIAIELWKIFCQFGPPKIVQSDNGGEFRNQIINKMLELVGVDKRLVAPYHPRGDGLAERFVQTSMNVIRKLSSDDKENWDKHVPGAQMAINNKFASIHGSQPYALMFGRRMNMFEDLQEVKIKQLGVPALEKRIKDMKEVIYPLVRERMNGRKERMATRFNKIHFIREYPVGSWAMVRETVKKGKLLPRYHGPYKIRKKVRGAYLLEDTMKIRPNGRIFKSPFAAWRLKPATPPSQTWKRNVEISHGKV